MRPIFWGIIFFMISGIGWVGFSVILGIGQGLGGEAPPPILNFLFNLFAFFFYLSLPVAIIIEIILLIKRKRERNK